MRFVQVILRSNWHIRTLACFNAEVERLARHVLPVERVYSQRFTANREYRSALPRFVHYYNYYQRNGDIAGYQRVSADWHSSQTAYNACGKFS